MTDWQLDMTKAPYTGKSVLVAVMRFLPLELAEGLERLGARRAEIFYARYSTWDGCWRSVHDGRMLMLHEFNEPHAWADVTEPPVKDR
jgi:hypothetical protein